MANGPGLDFDRERHVGDSFNIKAAPFIPGEGFFVGDYNSIAASARTGAFEAIWVATDCANTSCTAIANPTGAPTGGKDRTNVFVHRVAGGDNDERGDDDDGGGGGGDSSQQ